MSFFKIFCALVVVFSVIQSVCAGEALTPNFDRIVLEFRIPPDQVRVTLSVDDKSESGLEIFYGDEHWKYGSDALRMYPELDPNSLKVYVDESQSKLKGVLCIDFGEYKLVERFKDRVWSKNKLEVRFGKGGILLEKLNVADHKLPTSTCTINESPSSADGYPEN